MSFDEAVPDIPYRETGFETIRSDLALRQLIAGLPAQSQEILLLRFGHDLTIREVAKAVNLPPRTVQSRLRAALKKIKKDLEQEKGGTS